MISARGSATVMRVQQEWHGWCVQDGQRYAIRVLAARLPPEAAARARQRTTQQAQKHGRTPSAVTVALAEWVIVVTTLSADWTLQDVLRLYRARWAVELVFKRMKQLLRFNQVRSTHRTTVEATIRALLIAWAVQEEVGADAAPVPAGLGLPDPRGHQSVAHDQPGAGHPAAAGPAAPGPRHGSACACPVSGGFSAVVRADGLIRKPWCAPGSRGVPCGHA